MPAPSTTYDLLSLHDAAGLVGVNPRTIRRWVAAGHLTAYRFGPRVLRVRRDDVERLGRAVPTAAPR